MKLCKYCNALMMSEYETNAKNSHRYKGFHTCPKCGAVCDDEVLENKKDKPILKERWYNPSIKEFE